MSADTASSFLREHPEGCSLAVRVQPGARQTAITGVYGDSAESQLKIALKSPPIEGRANDALVEFLAELFDVPRAAVSIAHGLTNRSKTVRLKGISCAQAMALLEAKTP